MAIAYTGDTFRWIGRWIDPPLLLFYWRILTSIGSYPGKNAVHKTALEGTQRLD